MLALMDEVRRRAGITLATGTAVLPSDLPWSPDLPTPPARIDLQHPPH
jgi:hypothetical protein